MILFIDKENYEVTSCVSLTGRIIDIFTSVVSFLNKVNFRPVCKYLSDFLWRDLMFPRQFFNNIVQPNETLNLHVRLLIS